MTVSLATLLKKPTQKDFHYVVINDGLVPHDGDPAAADMTLRISYRTKRQVKDFLTDAITRRAVSTEGIKAAVADRDTHEVNLAAEVLQSFMIKPIAAYAMGFEGDLSGLAPDEVIEDNPVNRKHLFQSSTLSEIVTGVLQDHSKWYARPKTLGADSPREDGVPNS